MKSSGTLTFYLLSLSAFILILGPFSAQAKCEGNSHNEYFGQRKPGDELVYQDNIKSSWKLFQHVTRDVNYPLRGQLGEEITYIEIIDNYTNGHGGCAYITEGGVGKEFVKIHIKSQLNRGLDFVIKIYGLKLKL